MLTKIKQFVFYLGYELSLFQKVVVGFLGIAVVGFLGMQGAGLIANVSSGLLKGSVTEGGEAPPSAVLSIMNVDQTGLSATGNLSVKYALSTKPEAALKFILTVTSDEVEIGKTESESAEQSGILTLQIDEAHRTIASFTLRVTAEGGGLSLSDAVTILSGPAPLPGGGIPTASSGAVLPGIPLDPSPTPTIPPSTPPAPTSVPVTGSGSLPSGFGDTTTDIPVTPTPSGTGAVIPTPAAQCTAVGRACSDNGDCCSQRCAQVNVGTPKVMLCLPAKKAPSSTSSLP